MALDFGRVRGNGEVSIDYATCISCGLCARVCSGPLYYEEGKTKIDPKRFWGCIACGQCVTVCPRKCVTVKGRDLSPEDIRSMPGPAESTNYSQLYSLMLPRRSTRKFQEKPVPREALEQILEAASTAPMGIPPSEVSVLVFSDPKKVKEFRDDVLVELRETRKWLTPLVLKLMRPFAGQASTDLLREFVVPAIDMFLKNDEEGKDLVFYSAPAVLYFFGSGYADPADPIIAGTYAMLAAQTLGLGSCILGFPPPMIQRSKKMKEKYGLPGEMQPGMVLALGYPQISYKRAIKRRFAATKFF